MCKISFSSLIHNVEANDKYSQYKVEPKAQSTGLEVSLGEARRFRYRTTRVPGQPRAPRSSEQQMGVMVVERRERERQERERERQERREKRRQEMANPASDERRRVVYSLGLWAQPPSTEQKKERVREISPAFFRQNPACTHRLVPWLTREFRVLLGPEHVQFMIQLVLSLISKIDLEGEEFPEHLQPFLLTRTTHFLHEFASFARSPFNMAAYGKSVRYDWPTDRVRDDWDPEATVNIIAQHSPQPGSSGLSSEQIQERLFHELTATRWEDSPPFLPFPSSPILVHGSDSESDRGDSVHSPCDSGTTSTSDAPSASGTRSTADTPTTGGTRSTADTLATSGTTSPSDAPSTNGTSDAPSTGDTRSTADTPTTGGTRSTVNALATSGTTSTSDAPSTNGTSDAPSTGDTRSTADTPTTSGTRSTADTLATSGTTSPSDAPSTNGTSDAPSTGDTRSTADTPSTDGTRSTVNASGTRSTSDAPSTSGTSDTSGTRSTVSALATHGTTSTSDALATSDTRSTVSALATSGTTSASDAPSTSGTTSTSDTPTSGTTSTADTPSTSGTRSTAEAPSNSGTVATSDTQCTDNSVSTGGSTSTGDATGTAMSNHGTISGSNADRLGGEIQKEADESNRDTGKERDNNSRLELEGGSQDIAKNGGKERVGEEESGSSNTCAGDSRSLHRMGETDEVEACIVINAESESEEEQQTATGVLSTSVPSDSTRHRLKGKRPAGESSSTRQKGSRNSVKDYGRHEDERSGHKKARERSEDRRRKRNETERWNKEHRRRHSGGTERRHHTYFQSRYSRDDSSSADSENRGSSPTRRRDCKRHRPSTSWEFDAADSETYYVREKHHHRSRLYSDDYNVDCGTSTGKRAEKFSTPASEYSTGHRPRDGGRRDRHEGSKLHAELCSLDREIVEHKRGVLKAMLRCERLKLLHRQLQGEDLTDDYSNKLVQVEQPLVINETTPTEEMVQELAELDRAIVDGKKRVLHVMKKIEEQAPGSDMDSS